MRRAALGQGHARRNFAGVDQDTTRRADARLLGGIVALGIVLRIVQYFWRQSYWHDEVFLVFTISEGNFADAFGPLRLFQATPPVFLILQMAIRHLLGDGEYALRLLPLVMGCASVAMMAVLARRLAGPTAAVVAVTLFALSDKLIWHSVESKQYGGDVFCALVLLLIATGGSVTTRRFVAVAAFAAAAVWFSHPIVFLFGGASLAVLITTPIAQSRTGLSRYVAINALFAASFAMLYWFVLRDQQYPYFYEYWNDQMVPWTAPQTLPLWFGRLGFDLFDYSYESTGVFLFPLGIVGAISLKRRNGGALLLGLLLWPAALNLLASALHRYPFSGTRATVYLAPALLLLSSMGIESLIRHSVSLTWRRLAYLLPATLIIVGLIRASYHLVVPRQRGHVREPAAFVREHRAGDEPVYVLGQISPVEFYLRGVPTRLLTLEQLASTRDESCWVVYGYSNERVRNQHLAAIRQLGQRMSLTAQKQVTGGAAFHFEANTTSQPTSGRAKDGT